MGWFCVWKEQTGAMGWGIAASLGDSGKWRALCWLK